MKRLFLLLALALPGLAPAPVTAQTAADPTALTALDRDYEARGWEAVGRLDTGDGFCSATLIAPDLVLSAAHCLFDRAGQSLAPEAITFHAGLRNGTAVATRGIARLAAHQDAQEGPPPLGLHLVIGSDAAVKVRNRVENIAAGRIAPIDMIARLPG